MPTFEYKCPKCGEKSEWEVTHADGTKVDKKQIEYAQKTLSIFCDKCWDVKLERIYSAPSIHFKGEGFTKTKNN